LSPDRIPGDRSALNAALSCGAFDLVADIHEIVSEVVRTSFASP